ncbi:MAG TPA: hypothetical protein VIT93_05885, partial [Dehalococcoidia bacterium]
MKIVDTDPGDRGRATARGLLAWVIGATLLALVFGLFTGTLPLAGFRDSGLGGADFIEATTDDPVGSTDPGYEKDVATCTATVLSDELVEVVITNAYPSYTCTFSTVIENTGVLPVLRGTLLFDVPPVLTLTEITGHTEVLLEPGQRDIEEFSVHVEQEAEQQTTYVFRILKPFELHATGTPGFWRNWDSHDTFTQSEIETWLAEIDSASLWFGPTTSEGMEEVFDGASGKNASPESRFLGPCLATRLNERSGILDPVDTHDVAGEDKHNWLALAAPDSASLAEIIAAIESKFGTS